MDPELAALAASGATTLVGLMVTDSWEQVKQRVAAFFGRGRAEQTEEVSGELQLAHDEVTTARESDDAEAVQEIENEWRGRLRQLLRADPEAAAELRRILDELTPQTPPAESGSVHNTISGGVHHGTVIQARDISGGLSIGGGGIPDGRPRA